MIKLHIKPPGSTIDEWLDPETPDLVRGLYCPYIANRKSLDRCGETDDLDSNVVKCKYFKDKVECWAMFDALQAQ